MRWSINNWILPISHIQFSQLVAEFKAAAQKSFGTACVLEVRAMDKLKETSNFIHDDWVMDAMAKSNESHTFFATTDLNLVTEQIFNTAAYIEVHIRPSNEAHAPASAWAHAEFKGRLPRQATFYLHPDDAEPLRSMRASHRLAVFGDGDDSNTDSAIGFVCRLGPFCITF